MLARDPDIYEIEARLFRLERHNCLQLNDYCEFKPKLPDLCNTAGTNYTYINWETEIVRP